MAKLLVIGNIKIGTLYGVALASGLLPLNSIVETEDLFDEALTARLVVDGFLREPTEDELAADDAHALQEQQAIEEAERLDRELLEAAARSTQNQNGSAGDTAANSQNSSPQSGADSAAGAGASASAPAAADDAQKPQSDANASPPAGATDEPRSVDEGAPPAGASAPAGAGVQSKDATRKSPPRGGGSSKRS